MNEIADHFRSVQFMKHFFEESHFEKLLFNQTFDRWPKILKKNLIAHFHTQINDYYDRLMIVN